MESAHQEESNGGKMSHLALSVHTLAPLLYSVPQVQKSLPSLSQEIIFCLFVPQQIDKEPPLFRFYMLFNTLFKISLKLGQP